MDIAIPLPIPKPLHHRGHGIPQMEWNSEISMGFCIFHGLKQSDIGGIIFVPGREIGRPLGQVDLRLGEPHKLHGLSDRSRDHQAHRIGIPHVLGGKNNHAPGDKFRVLSPFQHTGEPVEGAVRIGIPQAFNVGRDDVVMFFAGFVVAE